MAKLPVDPELQVASSDSEWPALLNATGISSKLDLELFANVDWDCFLAGAEYHGVAAVVAQRILDSELRSRLDAGVERRLRQVYQTILMRSFPLAQEIHSITRAFKNENVPIIPYKGPALAERYWGSFAV
ncbi:MAG TPA: nucleotidyltransferase family protein, partial [Terriglobales bacterium]|nr:nucleotidyltransferase family protein [Terriglobales bacterium]